MQYRVTITRNILVFQPPIPKIVNTFLMLKDSPVTLIKPNRSWLYIDLKSIWEYRDLLLILIRRDFVSRYKQTILGPLWFIIQPVIMTLLFTLIFNRVAQIPTDGVSAPAFYMCGLLVWNYFQNVFSSISTIFTDHLYIFSKVYFPRIIMPLASCGAHLFTVAIQLILFFACIALLQPLDTAVTLRFISVSLFWLPLLLGCTIIFVLGFGFWMSAITAKYRDLAHVKAMLMQIMLYLSPIVYSIHSFPQKLQWLLWLNPLAGIVQSLRNLYFGLAPPEYSMLAVGATISLILFLSGMVIFQRVERTAVDYA